MSEACDDCFVEPFHIFFGLGLIGGSCQLLHAKPALLACQNFKSNLDPLTESEYVFIPYEMTQLSTSMVQSLLYVTQLSGMNLISLVYRSVKAGTR